ncbi:MAG: hypothetical protein J3K34DRAFT_457213 [Monoraphidium minutum]|nr:MAG: hypothetical protein J3K34DRAFT_457213 [Monoraphidium minutum]
MQQIQQRACGGMVPLQQPRHLAALRAPIARHLQPAWRRAAPAAALPKPQQPAASPAARPPQQQRPLPARTVVCAAGGSGAGGAGDGGFDSGNLISAALLALWAGLLGYVFVLAPNQTPTIDAFVVQKLVGLKQEDPFVVNSVFAALFNAMGLYPLIYAALLIPAARSSKLPAWPFVATSVFMGAYALIPYMALWSPKDPPEQLPPPKEELEGVGRLFMKGAETAVLPALLVAGAGFYVSQMATAGGDNWRAFLQLFDQSRLVHATTIDFMLCTLLAPFWMSNDAEGRNWEQRGTLLPVLSVLPLVGPALYLLLRPKTDLKATE